MEHVLYIKYMYMYLFMLFELSLYLTGGPELLDTCSVSSERLGFSSSEPVEERGGEEGGWESKRGKAS